jgi:hypothetical protein
MFLLEFFLDELEPETALCGAKTRTGHPCRRAPAINRRRCKLHGGASTGPRTAAGKARIAAAQRERWTRSRMRTVRILADREVHDGLGGVHKRGDTPKLPPDVVEIFLSRGLAELVEP